MQTHVPVQIALLADLHLTEWTLVRVLACVSGQVFLEEQHAAVKNLVTEPLPHIIVKLALDQKLVSLFTLGPDVDDSEHVALFFVKVVIVNAHFQLGSLHDGGLATGVNPKLSE